jgi:hypothetical protein
MINLKYAVVGLAALGGVALGSDMALAMPNGMPSTNQLSNVENVVMVCNEWGRCWWRPNYYVAPRVYGYRAYAGPRYYGGYGYGYRRDWRRW